MRDDGGRALERRLPRRRSGRLRSGSSCRRYSAVSSPASSASAISAAERPGAASLRPGPTPGRTPASRRPRPLVHGGHLEQARRRRGPSRAPRRAGEVQQRPRGVGAGGPLGQPLAVDDDDVLAGVRQHPGDGLHVVGRRAGGVRQPGDGARAPHRGADRGGEGRAAAGREARDGVRVAVQRRRAARRDGELHVVAAHALADAQVEDRHVVDRLAVEDEDGVGELEVGHRRLRVGVAERHVQLARERRARARVQVPRAERLAHDALQEEALLVRRLTAGQRGGARAGAPERPRRPRRARPPSSPGAARRRRAASAA